jgi:hypothetical protein
MHGLAAGTCLCQPCAELAKLGCSVHLYSGLIGGRQLDRLRGCCNLLRIHQQRSVGGNAVTHHNVDAASLSATDARTTTL